MHWKWLAGFSSIGKVHYKVQTVININAYTKLFKSKNLVTTTEPLHYRKETCVHKSTVTVLQRGMQYKSTVPFAVGRCTLILQYWAIFTFRRLCSSRKAKSTKTWLNFDIYSTTPIQQSKDTVLSGLTTNGMYTAPVQPWWCRPYNNFVAYHQPAWNMTLLVHTNKR